MALMKKNSSLSSAVASYGSAFKEKRRQRMLAKQEQISDSIAGVSMIILENAQESVSAIKELKSSMEQIATTTEKNSGVSKHALTNVNTTNSTIPTLISSTFFSNENIMTFVTKINDSVQRMLHVVKIAEELLIKGEELQKSSKNIGDVVDYSVKFAEQIKLLALNGAIEVNRAKEHSEGFEIVAAEIRVLADESEVNAEFISESVAKIQISIDELTISINKSTKAISASGSKGSSLSKKMHELIKIAGHSFEATRSLSTYTQKLDNYAEKINDTSQEIADKSNKISASVENTINSIDIQSVALSQIEKDIKELSNFTEELRYSRDTLYMPEDIAISANTIGSSMEDIKNAFKDATGELKQIELASYKVNKSSLINQESIQAGIDAAKETDKFIEILRRNFDLLKLSFVSIKKNINKIKGKYASSISHAIRAESKLNLIVKEIRDVDKRVGKISNLVIRLNMLGVSGSIEAARAGVFGKGFGIVSANIKNLAKDSELDTDTINDIVAFMNSEIDMLKNDWNYLLLSQKNEQVLIENLLYDIVEIIKMLDTLLDGYKDLKDANNQNLDAMNKVMIGIKDIQNAVDHNVINAIDSYRASEHISERISYIGDGVEELVIMADELQEG